MQIYETFDPTPFRVNAYRTDEALFLHIFFPSMANERKLFVFIIKLLSCLLFPFILLLCADRNIVNIIAPLSVLVIFCSLYLCLLWFSIYFFRRQLLIRIDRSTIQKTSWYFGKEFHISRKRPDKILFKKHDGKWCMAINNGIVTIPIVTLPVRYHELQWIGDIVGQFENEIPTIDVAVASGNVETADSILNNMEYQGQKLQKILNPIEQVKSNNITKKLLPDKLPAGTLRVCCSRCHSLLPTDYVFADNALAKCPSCGFLFEIADLKRYPVSHGSCTEIQADENVLKLHQCPYFFHSFLFIILPLICVDIFVAYFYFLIYQINPAVTLDIITTDEKLTQWFFVMVIVHVLSFLFFMWSFFVHRFIEFRRNEIYFCIHWLCFSRSWTVPRRFLDTCQLSLFTMPYQKSLLIRYGKKSFRIGVRSVEISWVVGEINYWLMTHPPDEFLDSDYLPTFENNKSNSFSDESNNLIIGGITEIDNKEIRCHCGNCGHRLLAEELDFPNRIASCPNCHKTSDFSQLQYYALEHKATKPESENFTIEKSESEKEQQIKFSTTPLNIFEKITYGIIGIIPTFFLLLVMTPFIGTKIFQHLNFVIALLFIFPLVLFVISPCFLIIIILIAQLYDKYRQKFTTWTTCFSDGYFELTRRYKNYSETIRIETERIARFRRGRAEKNLSEFIKNFPIFNHFPSTLEDRGHVRNEIILTDGTTIYLPILREPKNNHGWNNWLVNTWNEQLYQHR